MQSAILALDMGTSAVKGVAFDLDGNILARHEEEYSLDMPGPDMVELDPEVYWESTRKLLKAMLNQVSAKKVIGIGVTSQGETLITVNKKGETLRPAIVWLDNRSTSEAAEIDAHWPIDTVYHIDKVNIVILYC